MKKRSVRSLIVAAASVGLALGVVAPASASTYVGGGFWDHGTYWMSGDVQGVYSNYQHYTKAHMSSVDSPCGYHSSGWQPAYVTSYANAVYCYLGGNKAYWNTL